ncbi:MAG: hypothetical protein ACE367_03400 [Acidimicrobiales bacterium]
MNDLHDALDRLAEEGVAGISLRNPADDGATRSAAPRGRGPVALALAAIVILIVGIAGVLVLGDDGSDDPGESVVAGPGTEESPGDGEDDAAAGGQAEAGGQVGVGGQGDVGGQAEAGAGGDGADGDSQLVDALAAAVPAVLGGDGPSVSVPASALPDGTRADLYDLDGARRGPAVDGFGVVVVPALDGADRSFCLVMTSDERGWALDIDGAPAAVCTSPAELVTDGWVGVAGDTGPRDAKGPWVVVGAVAPDVTGIEVDGNAAVVADGGLFIAVGSDATEVRLVRPEQRAVLVEACDALSLLATAQFATSEPEDVSPEDLDRLIAAAGRTSDPAFAPVGPDLEAFAGRGLAVDDRGSPAFPDLGWVDGAIGACRDQHVPGFAQVWLSPWPPAPVPQVDLSAFGTEQPLEAGDIAGHAITRSLHSLDLGPIAAFEVFPGFAVARSTSQAAAGAGATDCVFAMSANGGASACGRDAEWMFVPFSEATGRGVVLATVDAEVAFVVADVDGEQLVQRPVGGQVAMVVGAGPGTVSFYTADGEVLSTRPLER